MERLEARAQSHQGLAHLVEGAAESREVLCFLEKCFGDCWASKDKQDVGDEEGV